MKTLFLSLAAGIAALLVAPGAAHAQNVSLAGSLDRWGYVKTVNNLVAVGSGTKARKVRRNAWSLKGFTVEATENRAVVTVGGVNVWLNSAIAEDSGSLFIQKRDLDKSITPILAPSKGIVRRIRTIVLDPGHGGRDPGKQNFSLKLNEKTLTLDVVRRLESILENKGYKVLVTRTRDNYVDLDDRCAFANRHKADLFVSIHFNAAENKGVTGFETYCLTPAYQYSTNDSERSKKTDTRPLIGNRNDDGNILFAYLVQKRLSQRLESEDRGVRRARFAIFRDLNCPGVLIESGFLSNTGEAKLIADPKYRERIADCVAEAVSQYHAKLIALSKRK